MDIRFVLRKNTRSKGKPATLYCRITLNGHRAGDFSTFIKVPPKEWDSKAQVIVSRRAEADSDNDTLNNVRTSLKDIFNERIRKGQPVTAILIKQEYLKLSTPACRFLDAFTQLIERKAVRKLAASTIRKNQVLLSNTRKFLESIGRVDLLPDEWDVKLADDLEIWLRAHLSKCGHDHAMKHLLLIKQVLKYCVRQKYIRFNPLQEYELTWEKPKFPVYLTLEELAQMEQYSFASSSLQKTADIYLFCCYTGFSYSDYSTFHPDEHVQYLPEGVWLFKDRMKTGETAILPFLAKAQQILDKYNGRLPKMQIQPYNRFIKEVGQILGIRKRLTTHTARKTAAMMWLNKGVPEETVAQMLGQTTTQNLRRYARILPVRISRDTEPLLG